MNNDEFLKEISKLGINYSSNEIEKLNKYYEMLIDYNNKTNVTAITDKSDVYLKHFYDSLTLSKIINLNDISSMLDIGSGAGFPGIVIAIFFPKIEVTVLDSNNKKTTFMKNIVNSLKLNNCTVINARAEDYAKDHLNEFDLVTSRAVAYIDIITELSMPFVKKEGKIVLMKGTLKDELVVLDNHKNDLNIAEYKIKTIFIKDTIERNFIILKKNKINHKIMNYSQIKKRNLKWVIEKTMKKQ